MYPPDVASLTVALGLVGYVPLTAGPGPGGLAADGARATVRWNEGKRWLAWVHHAENRSRTGDLLTDTSRTFPMAHCGRSGAERVPFRGFEPSAWCEMSVVLPSRTNAQALRGTGLRLRQDVPRKMGIGTLFHTTRGYYRKAIRWHSGVGIGN